MPHMKISPATASNRSDTVWYILTILIFISLVSLAGYLFIQQQKRFLLDEKYKELSTIVDIKASQLFQWRKERIAEGSSIRANAMMAHRINDYNAGRNKEQIRREIQHWMANLVDLGGYSKAILFSTNGNVITSDTELKAPPSQHYLNHVFEAAREHELILSDFHRDFTGAPYDIDLTIPIMFFDGVQNRCIAVLTLDIGPAKRLFPLITSWPTTSTTAETLLVRREGDFVLFLNEPRYHTKSDDPFVHPLTNKNMPAVRAALGQEGTFEGVDYRNVAVISAIRTIPGTWWGLVAKIDVSEALAPLQKTILKVRLVGCVVVIAMVMGLFLWGMRRKAETLRKLVEMQKMAESELQHIHAQLEQQIQERTRDLLEINEHLREEMAEREQLEQQLLSAKRLEAIGQIAGGVAHEVRNPLNAILTITEALFREKEIENNPGYEPYIHHIRTQVTRLVHLMNDLLDLGRSIPETNLQPIPLYGLCQETIDLWNSSGTSAHKCCTLLSDSVDGSVPVLADALKLQQIIFNLLENAGDHSPADSMITIQLMFNSDPADGMAVIQVIDQGSGIDAATLPRIFDPFYTGRKGGTGLGLALVKHFIENMGGTVSIRNNTPPPGCTAEVHIPLYSKESQ